MRDNSADEPTPRGRLKRRAEFLRVGKGRRWHGTAMSLQAEARPTMADEPESFAPRFGFTLTKKVGNSVVRNRARRRLREAVRLAPADLPARDGHDYVIIGRLDALRVPFAALLAELARGLAAVHSRSRAPRAKAHAETEGRAAPERIRPKT